MCRQACRKVEDAKLLISVHQEYLPVYQDMDEAGDARDHLPMFPPKKDYQKTTQIDPLWISTGTAPATI